MVLHGILAAEVNKSSPDTVTNGFVSSDIITEPSVLTLHNKDEGNETQKSFGWFWCRGARKYVAMLLLGFWICIYFL